MKQKLRAGVTGHLDPRTDIVIIRTVTSLEKIGCKMRKRIRNPCVGRKLEQVPLPVNEGWR